MAPSSVPVSDFARGVLSADYAALRACEPAARQEGGVDGVHDMRVATRRLRADLATFRDVLPLVFQGLRDELKWLGSALGAVRDLDVQLEALRRARSEEAERLEALEPLIAELNRLRDEAQAELGVAMASQRYEDLIAGFDEALDDNPTDSPDDSPVGEFAPKVMRKRWRRLRMAAEALDPDSAPELFHATRIAAKKLRYTVEGFLPLFGEPAERLADEATRMQDVLGQHQDLIVLNRRLESLVRDGTLLPPWSLVVLGELIERNRIHAQRIRDEWPGLDETRKRWRELKDVTRG